MLVGDLNSAQGDTSTSPPDPTPNGLAYALVTGAGYADTWLQARPGDSGFTSGFNEFVNDPDASGLDHRIDHVMTRGATAEANHAEVTGVDLRDRTPEGLWPSDHAGVVTRVFP